MKTLFLGIFALSLLFMISCETEEIQPIDTFQATSVTKSKLPHNKSITVITIDNFNDFIEPVEIAFDENAEFVDEFIDSYHSESLTLEQWESMLDLLNISENTNVDELATYNDQNDVYDYTPTLSDCDKLVEIRDAMLSECDQYVFGLDEICSGAVMVAYWIKSDRAGC